MLLQMVRSHSYHLILEREEGGGWRQAGNIDHLPPICALTGDGTHNLFFGLWDDAPMN